MDELRPTQTRAIGVSGPRTRRTAALPTRASAAPAAMLPDAGNDGDESEEEGELPLLQGEGRLDRRDAGDERGEAQPLGGIGDGAGPSGSGIGVGHVRTIAAREPAEAPNENGTPPEGGVPSARTEAGARRIGDSNP